MARVNGGRRQTVAQRQGCETEPLVEDFAANVRQAIWTFLMFLCSIQRSVVENFATMAR